ncbi:uncharacterized protein C17orf50 homolog [Hemicordylus capensis]|uniref:uncharacterized protein C17orf50 homolog n=1 Tax=Hemicordylus capensis TaxID=884348 RepID=UPI0023020F18|nr:uncharacterized protein C17orf50 homolog [Hemicordylus capensis]
MHLWFEAVPMSQSRQDQDEGVSEEKQPQEPEASEKESETDPKEASSSSLLFPQTSSVEQKQQENWLWGWLPLPLLSGLTWLGDRNRATQEPVCCCLERRQTSGKMCPECEIVFCKKCEKLHYSRAFIEHGLLGHNTENLMGMVSPVLSSGSIDPLAIAEETEDEE